MIAKYYHKDASLVRGYQVLKIVLCLSFFFFSFCLGAKQREDLAGEYFYIAQSYSELKKYERAIEFYKKAEKNPEYSNAANYNIARMYALLNQWEKAASLLKTLHEKEPSNMKVLTAYAYALVATGNIEEGESMYKNIYECEGESPEAAFNYVRLLIIAKKYDVASELLDGLKDKFIEDEEAKTIASLKKTIEKLIDPLKEEKQKEKEEEEREEETDEEKNTEEGDESSEDATKDDKPKEKSNDEKVEKKGLLPNKLLVDSL